MAQLIFTHPSKNVGSLTLNVKPDEITWAYGLNVQSYPTYGGEVVQILSCYIEDLTVKGTARNYRQLESIYKWFIQYIQHATQKGEFDVRPVTMFYPERGWKFKLYPKQLPSFKYGRDVVAPEWTMTAAVVEPDPQLVDNILDAARIQALGKQNVELFGKATGNIGFEPDDPFSSPDGDTPEARKKAGFAKRSNYDLGDWFNNLIPSYLNNDFKDLSADYSRPTGFPSSAGGSSNQPQKPANRNGNP